MVKIKEPSTGTPKNTPKAKKPPKNKALTSPRSSKSPKKSFSTPEPHKGPKDNKKRRSMIAFPVPQFEETGVTWTEENLGKLTDKAASIIEKNKRPKSVLETPETVQLLQTPKSTKKKLAEKVQNPESLQNGTISNQTLKSNKKKKINENSASELPVKKLKRKSIANTENEIKITPKNLKKVLKHTPLVLAPKSESPTLPLILAPKARRAKIKKESKVKPAGASSKNNVKALKKLLAKEADAERSVLDISELEKTHSILIKDVKSAIEGVIKFATNNPKLKNQLLISEIPLFLQINSFKIPKTRGPIKHINRVPLEHSLLTQDSDICLILPDVKGIPNKELERHQEHYEKLLADKGVKNIKKIMTFYEFRTEYETFELKNKLADLYDVFLVDGKISGKVVHKGGQAFYKKRKVPLSIKLHVSKLANHIEDALKKVYFDMNCKSDSCIMQFGHNKLTTQQLIDNVYSVVKFLDKKFPGGMQNIRSLNVYAHRGSSIPVYLSLKDANEIKVPVLKQPKPKNYKSYLGELTTQYNADVLVRPSGKVIVRRHKMASDQVEVQEDNVITDKDILEANKIENKAKKEENKKGKKRKISENNNNVEVKEELVKVEGKKIKKEKVKPKIKEEIVQNNVESTKVKKEKVKPKIKQESLENNEQNKKVKLKVSKSKLGTVKSPKNKKLTNKKSKKLIFSKI